MVSAESGKIYCERGGINESKIVRIANSQKNEISPSAVARRNSYNSRQAMMCGATWNPMMPGLSISKVLTGVGKAMKLGRVGAPNRPK